LDYPARHPQHRHVGLWPVLLSDKEMWALASFLRRIDNLPAGVLKRIQAKKAPDTGTN
jgi:hypothetical protein